MIEHNTTWRFHATAMVVAAVLSTPSLALGQSEAPETALDPVSAGICDPASVFSLSDSQPVASPETETRQALNRLRGKWHLLQDVPFGSNDGVGVWTGSEMLVFDPSTRRAAGYDPESRRWSRYPKAPGRMLGGTAVWTGEEMIVAGRAGHAVRAFALDPTDSSWRELPAPPPGISSVVDAAWSGDVMVVGTDRKAAAYDPAGDCWVDLPDIPGERRLNSLSAAGDLVLAVTGSRDGDPGVVVASLDTGSGSWSMAAPSGLFDEANAGVWTGRELVVLSRDTQDDSSTSAAYDPSSDTWRALDLPCAVNTTTASVWTGDLIITDSPGAVDPVSEACLRLPSRDRTRSDAVRIWTGERVVEWSGARGDDMTIRVDGIHYRPR